MIGEMKNFKAVFVDLDGTLIDSLPLLFRTYQQFLADFGIEGTRKEFEELNGPSLPHFVNKLRLLHNLKVPVEQLLSKYHAILNQATVSDLPLFIGARTSLEELHKLGYKLVLVSSADSHYARRILIAHELAPLFDLVVAPEYVENISKPDPRIYLYALERTGLTAQEAVAIEDSNNGVRASTGAGILTLHFRSQQSDNPLVLPMQSWEEILQFIENPHAEI